LQVRQAEVMGIDFDQKKVIVVQGARRVPVDLYYDELVIALGTTRRFGSRLLRASRNIATSLPRSGHIPAAVSIPLDELAEQLAELPDDQDIVAYCRGAYCVLAHEAVRLLTDHGRSAMRLADGMLEWRLADLPVAT
jgi:rhodanese-related sulfurtransferase